MPAWPCRVPSGRRSPKAARTGLDLWHGAGRGAPRPEERSRIEMTSTVVRPAAPADEFTPRHLRDWAPWVWVAPAIIIVCVFLLYPVINTLWLSLFNADSTAFVGLRNYGNLFTNP